MAEAEASGRGAFLTQKMGPLPVWAWFGLGVAVFFVMSSYKKQKGSTSNTSSSSPANETIGYVDANGNAIVPTSWSYVSDNPPGGVTGNPISPTPVQNPPVQSPTPGRPKLPVQRPGGGSIPIKSPVPKPVASPIPRTIVAPAPTKVNPPKPTTKPVVKRTTIQAHPNEGSLPNSPSRGYTDNVPKNRYANSFNN